MGNTESQPVMTNLVQVQPIDTTPPESHDTGIDIVNGNHKRMSWDWYGENMNTKNHTENTTEEKNMHDDMETYGKYDNGFYKDTPWEMHRISLSGNSEHWCGYVLYNGDLNDDELELVEEKAHGELTDRMGGGDFAHFDVYAVSHKNVTYRNHAYVLNCLQGMIDVLIETKSFNKRNFREFTSIELIK